MRYLFLVILALIVLTLLYKVQSALRSAASKAKTYLLIATITLALIGLYKVTHA